ncbi:MAG: hypothetical protein ACE366_21315 [Bradymonadia bacterium]
MKHAHRQGLGGLLLALSVAAVGGCSDEHATPPTDQPKSASPADQTAGEGDLVLGVTSDTLDAECIPSCETEGRKYMRRCMALGETLDTCRGQMEPLLDRCIDACAADDPEAPTCADRCAYDERLVGLTCLMEGEPPVTCTAQAERAVQSCEAVKCAAPEEDPVAGCFIDCSRQASEVASLCSDLLGDADHPLCVGKYQRSFGSCAAECPEPSPRTCEVDCRTQAPWVTQGCVEGGGDPERCEAHSRDHVSWCVNTHCVAAPAETCESLCRREAGQMAGACAAAGTPIEICRDEARQMEVQCRESRCERSCEDTCQLESEQGLRRCLSLGEAPPSECLETAHQGLHVCHVIECGAEPREETCHETCGAQGDALQRYCDRTAGISADQCAGWRRQFVEACEADRCPPPPVPCDQECLDGTLAALSNCLGNGGDRSFCLDTAERGLNQCLELRCDIDSPEPPACEGFECDQQACDAICRPRANLIFDACISSGEPPEMCEMQAGEYRRSCVDACLPPVPETCEEGCALRAAQARAACDEVNDGQADCDAVAEQVAQVCLMERCDDDVDQPPCEQACVIGRLEDFTLCVGLGRDVTECAAAIQIDAQACVQTCFDGPPTCEGECLMSSIDVFTECLAAGGTLEACGDRTAEHSEICEWQCERTPEHCADRCRPVAEARFERCLESGERPDVCQDQFVDQLDHCLSTCDQPCPEGCHPEADGTCFCPDEPLTCADECERQDRDRLRICEENRWDAETCEQFLDNTRDPIDACFAQCERPCAPGCDLDAAGACHCPDDDRQCSDRCREEATHQLTECTLAGEPPEACIEATEATFDICRAGCVDQCPADCMVFDGECLCDVPCEAACQMEVEEACDRGEHQAPWCDSAAQRGAHQAACRLRCDAEEGSCVDQCTRLGEIELLSCNAENPDAPEACQDRRNAVRAECFEGCGPICEPGCAPNDVGECICDAPTPCEAPCIERAAAAQQTCLAQGETPQQCQLQARQIFDACRRPCDVVPDDVPCPAWCMDEAGSQFDDCVLAGNPPSLCADRVRASYRQCADSFCGETPCVDTCLDEAQAAARECEALLDDPAAFGECMESIGDGVEGCMEACGFPLPDDDHCDFAMGCHHDGDDCRCPEPDPCHMACFDEGARIFDDCLRSGVPEDRCREGRDVFIGHCADACQVGCPADCAQPDDGACHCPEPPGCEEDCFARADEAFEMCARSGEPPEACAEMHQGMIEGCIQGCQPHCEPGCRPDAAGICQCDPGPGCEDMCHADADRFFEECLQSGAAPEQCERDRDQFIGECFMGCMPGCPADCEQLDDGACHCPGDPCMEGCAAEIDRIKGECQATGEPQENCDARAEDFAQGCFEQCQPPSCEDMCFHEAERELQACIDAGEDPELCAQVRDDIANNCLPGCHPGCPPDCELDADGACNCEPGPSCEEQCHDEGRRFEDDCLQSGEDPQFCSNEARMHIDSCTQNCQPHCPADCEQDADGACHCEPGPGCEESCHNDGNRLEAECLERGEDPQFCAEEHRMFLDMCLPGCGPQCGPGCWPDAVGECHCDPGPVCEDMCLHNADRFFEECLQSGMAPEQCERDRDQFIGECFMGCGPGCPADCEPSPDGACHCPGDPCMEGCAAEIERIKSECQETGEPQENCDARAQDFALGCFEQCQPPRCEAQCHEEGGRIEADCLQQGLSPEMCADEYQRFVDMCIPSCNPGCPADCEQDADGACHCPEPPHCEDHCHLEADRMREACYTDGGEPGQCEQDYDQFVNDCMQGCVPHCDPGCWPDDMGNCHCDPGPGCEEQCHDDGSRIEAECLERGEDPQFCAEEHRMFLDMCLPGCGPQCDPGCWPDAAGVCQCDPGQGCEDVCLHDADRLFEECLQSGAAPEQCERDRDQFIGECFMGCEPGCPADCEPSPDGACHCPGDPCMEGCAAEIDRIKGECQATGEPQENCDARAEDFAQGCFEQCQPPSCEDMCFHEAERELQACLDAGEDPELCAQVRDDIANSCLPGCHPGCPADCELDADGACHCEPGPGCEETCQDEGRNLEEDCLNRGEDPAFCADDHRQFVDMCIQSCQPGCPLDCEVQADGVCHCPDAPRCDEQCHIDADAIREACYVDGVDPNQCEQDHERFIRDCVQSCGPVSCEDDCHQQAAQVDAQCEAQGLDPETCAEEHRMFLDMCLPGCIPECPAECVPLADGSCDCPQECEGSCDADAQMAFDLCLQEGQDENICQLVFDDTRRACMEGCGVPQCEPGCAPAADGTCHCEPLDCMQQCAHQAQNEVDNCINAGEDPAVCESQHQEIFDGCAQACGPGPDPEVPCEEGCMIGADQFFQDCLSTGADEAQCQSDRQSFADACLAGCDPMEPPFCDADQGCFVDAAGVCQCGGGDPCEESCHIDAQLAFDQCAAEGGVPDACQQAFDDVLSQCLPLCHEAPCPEHCEIDPTGMCMCPPPQCDPQCEVGPQGECMCEPGGCEAQCHADAADGMDNCLSVGISPEECEAETQNFLDGCLQQCTPPPPPPPPQCEPGCWVGRSGQCECDRAALCEDLCFIEADHHRELCPEDDFQCDALHQQHVEMCLPGCLEPCAPGCAPTADGTCDCANLVCEDVCVIAADDAFYQCAISGEPLEGCAVHRRGEIDSCMQACGAR